MSKKKIKKEIFWKSKNDEIKWSDIKHIQFEDDDSVVCTYVEPYYSENESNDGHYLIEISRMVEETDEEYEKRINKQKQNEEFLKQKRYENYLKLKEEFDK
jgi:hypothetical protein